jgi:hypothetical protein
MVAVRDQRRWPRWRAWPAVASILKSRRFGPEFQLPGIIADQAKIVFGEAIGCFGVDFQRELDLRALCALKLHHHRTQDCIGDKGCYPVKQPRP